MVRRKSSDSLEPNPEDLEEALGTALKMFFRLKQEGVRSKLELKSMYYNMGLAMGIMQALRSLGHDEWVDRIINELEPPSEAEDPDVASLNRWFGRRVYFGSRYSQGGFPGGG